MTAAVKPDPGSRDFILESVQAEVSLCFTCGTCQAGCPINITTNRLQPLKIVRMANYGMIGEALALPELWYCLQCNQCIRECPMTVQPAALIKYLRTEAVNKGIVTKDAFEKYQELYKRFHRARWHLALALQSQPGDIDIAAQWPDWLNAPIPKKTDPIRPDDLQADRKLLSQAAGKNMNRPTDLSACFTCSGCSSVCPVFDNRDMFDPLAVFRMAGMGLKEELLNSPTVWLCLECQNCTEACTQGVAGHKVMQSLQEAAVAEGYFSPEFKARWDAAHVEMYNLFLSEIDAIFQFQAA